MNEAQRVHVVAIEPNGKEKQDGSVVVKIRVEPHLMSGQNKSCGCQGNGQGKPASGAFSVEGNEAHNQCRKGNWYIRQPIIAGSNHGIRSAHADGAGIGHDAKWAFGNEDYEQTAQHRRFCTLADPFFALTL